MLLNLQADRTNQSMSDPPPFPEPTKSSNVHQFHDGFYTGQSSLFCRQWESQKWTCLYFHKNAEVLNKEFIWKSSQAITNWLVNVHCVLLLVKFNLQHSLSRTGFNLGEVINHIWQQMLFLQRTRYKIGFTAKNVHWRFLCSEYQDQKLNYI